MTSLINLLIASFLAMGAAGMAIGTTGPAKQAKWACTAAHSGPGCKK